MKDVLHQFCQVKLLNIQEDRGMSSKTLSREELISVGWSDRLIDAALDAADEYGPSGHWLNKTGKPYYDEERVKVAAFKTGISKIQPNQKQLALWGASERPTSLPLLTFNFHRLADVCDPSVSREFWSLRLSHPGLGRQGGTLEKERLLIVKTLIKLIEYSSAVKLENFNALTQYLSDQSVKEAASLRAKLPVNAVVRKARRSSYVSRGTGIRSIQRFIDVLVMIYSGLVLGVDGQKVDPIDLLIRSPKFRIDFQELANA
jgi:hypothetical protein